MAYIFIEGSLNDFLLEFSVPAGSFFRNFALVFFSNLFKVRNIKRILDLGDEGSLDLFSLKTFPVESLKEKRLKFEIKHNFMGLSRDTPLCIVNF